MASRRKREGWGSQRGFVLAAAGAAVGLGNMWRFPYLVGENGGALFIFIYVACVLVVGLPLVLAEMTIGRAAQQNVVGAFRTLSPGTPWFLVGTMSALCSLLILSFCCVVTGWTLGYAVESTWGAISSANSEQDAIPFGELITDPRKAVGYFLVVIGVSVPIIAAGVKGGIERCNKVLMPALLVLLLLVIVRSFALPGFSAGLAFLFSPDFKELDATVFLRAMGQAFFSMSVGTGVMLTYGSYVRHHENLPQSTLLVGGIDLIVALLASVAIFPAVFALGMDPQAGPCLVFQTIPSVFGRIPYGEFFMIIFFLVLVVAALTSIISFMEVIAAFLVDELGWGRTNAAVIVGITVGLVGIPVALSMSSLSENVAGWNLMTAVEHVTADYLVPITAFFMSLFVGFAWNKKAVLAKVREGTRGFLLANVWLVVVRYVAPFIIAQIVVVGFLHESPAWQFADKLLTIVFSIVDAVLVVVLIIGTLNYINKNRGQRLVASSHHTGLGNE